ncbi:hypothetical protein RvY_12254-2 [Ramazzottius varieornatus]|nr:hypothetical protein RvY_12254-2 [Ramazzottius varieornatus]
MKFVMSPAGKVYCYIVAFVTTTLAVLTQMDYFGFYWKDIVTLDFFVLIRLINNNAVGVQVPLIFIVLIVSRRAAADFRMSLNETVPLVFSRPEIARIRKYCSMFLFIYISAILGITIAAVVQHQWTRLGFFHSVVIGYQNQSGYTGMAFALLTTPLCVNVDLASQMSGVTFIVVLASGFDKVRRTVEEAYCAMLPDTELSVVIQKATARLQKLRNLTADFNEAFGLLVLLQCVRDLVAVISFIALLLRYNGKLMDETSEQYDARSVIQARSDRWDYIFLTITLTHSVIRISVCLYCSKAVVKIIRLLQKVEIEVNAENVRTSCSYMLSKIDPSTGTISAGGFALINMEYVAGVFGALVAYGVVVYQASDSKEAAQELAKVNTVRYETNELKEFIRHHFGNFSQMP